MLCVGFYSGLSLAGCLTICTLIELLSMWNLTKVEIQLCNILSPEGPQMSLGSYNWKLVSIFFDYLVFASLSCSLSSLALQHWIHFIYCKYFWKKKSNYTLSFICQKVWYMLLTCLSNTFWQVFLAMLVDNFLYPISAVRSHFSQSINWSGVRYHLRDGKISKVPNFTRIILP